MSNEPKNRKAADTTNADARVRSGPSEHSGYETKNVFAVYQQCVDKFLDTVKQSVPKYHQSITNAQQEYVGACENVINSTISLQREYARRTGITANVPEATLKIMRNATDEAIKAASISNQITLATIDVTQQNVKTFNDNAKAFADLNRNIIQSWISAFVVRN